jgi:KaiC/GvpD/RAD55 family RecA-like ATPase
MAKSSESSKSKWSVSSKAIIKSLVNSLQKKIPSEEYSKILVVTDLTSYFEKMKEEDLRYKQIIQQTAKVAVKELGQTVNLLAQSLEKSERKFLYVLHLV